MTTVRITVKLFAMLSDYLPEGARSRHWMPLDVAEDETIDAVITRLVLPRPLCHLVLVNGDFVPPGERASRTFREGDVLAIWPPVAGG